MATRHRDPENTGLPTTSKQASAILQLNTTYLDAQRLLVHLRKSVRLADIGAPTPHIRKGEILHLEDTTIHLGVTQATRLPHCTPKQAGRAPRPTSQTCQGGPPVYAGPGILHGSGAQRSHRVPSSAPPAPRRRPTPRSTASNKGMGATRRLAHLFPQGGHDGPLALLRGQCQRPSRHGLCQTRSTFPTQSNTQPPTGGPRSGSHAH